LAALRWLRPARALDGRCGSVGKSLNAYNDDEMRWHETWIDSGEDRLVIARRARRQANGAGIGDGRCPDPAAAAQQRIAWTPNHDGSVRQLRESSADFGKTWAV